MATVYWATVVDCDTYAKDVASAGTSDTSTNLIGLRMGDGTNVPTLRQVENALMIFKRWLIQGGLDQAGANLPPNRG